MLAVLALFGLAGCYGGDPDSVPTEPEPDELGLSGCEDGAPDLTSGFSLERDVDYIADRIGDSVLSERGTPCDGATDEELCLGALATSSLPFRHLVTTEGGTVRVWESGSALALFGSVDSLSEAAWLAAAFDYFVPCDVQVDQTFGLFVLDGVEARWGCTTPQAMVTLAVSPEGLVNELRSVPVEGASCSPDFQVTGMPPIPLP